MGANMAPERLTPELEREIREVAALALDGTTHREHVAALLAELGAVRAERDDLRLLLGCAPEDHPEYAELVLGRRQPKPAHAQAEGGE
jgi:hypothetical protein